MDPTSRLRLATRIHFCLLRQFNEAVEVRALLDGSGEGREALWVCEASGDAEMMTLARDLVRENRRAAAHKRVRATVPADSAAGRVPQDTPWAQDTSGFGVSRPVELNPKARRAAASPSWFAPMDWLRRGASR